MAYWPGATDSGGFVSNTEAVANRSMRILNVALAALTLVRFPVEAQARTDPGFSEANWLSMGGLDGADNRINAVVPDKEGNVYVGGSFTNINTVIANGIAKWNGESWSALGAGMGFGGQVNALAFDTNGNLYVGGTFTTAGDISATNVAKWDGSSWSALSSGFGDTNGSVNALAFDTNGNLYAGWSETVQIPGLGATYVVGGVAEAGSSYWYAIGSGMDGGVSSLAFDGSGNLYAGGNFATAGGVSANGVAKWEWGLWGWSGLGSGLGGMNALGAGPWVNALAFGADGNLYAGGNFTTAGGVNATNIAQWDGSAWSALGSGLEEMETGTGVETDVYVAPEVTSLAFDSSGKLYVGMQLRGYDKWVGAWFNGYISIWDGATWSPLVSGLNGSVSALAFGRSGTLYAGEGFGALGGWNAGQLATWNGSAWSGAVAGSALSSPPGLFVNGASVSAVAFDASGNLYAGGFFVTTGGEGAANIAKWDGTSWSGLGSGVDYIVSALTSDTNGNLYAGGLFTTAGGTNANNIANWNGSAWSALGSGMDSPVSALVCDSSGNLYAGGYFTNAGGASANYVARWNGSAWFALGTGLDAEVNALACDTSGNLYAGGTFTNAGGVTANNIAKWDGNAWSALGSGMSGAPGLFSVASVDALACDSSGNLYAGGSFTNAGGVSANDIAKWDGSAWSALGLGLGGAPLPDGSAPYVSAIACDRKGNVYAGGCFASAGLVKANCVAKWDGSAWSPLGSGVGGTVPRTGGTQVSALALDGFGNLQAGGDFITAGTNVSFCLAKALLTGPTPNQLLLANAGGGTNVVAYLGTPGSRFALDLTTNLAPPVHWLPQVTNTASSANAATAGYLMFTNSNHLPQAYYRTRSVP